MLVFGKIKILMIIPPPSVEMISFVLENNPVWQKKTHSVSPSLQLRTLKIGEEVTCLLTLASAPYKPFCSFLAAELFQNLKCFLEGKKNESENSLPISLSCPVLTFSDPKSEAAFLDNDCGGTGRWS